MAEALQPILDKLWSACERSGAYGRTVTLKLKYADFQQLTRSQSFKIAVASRAELERVSFGVLAPLCPAPRGVRLLGVTLSTLTSKEDEPGSAEQMSDGPEFIQLPWGFPPGRPKGPPVINMRGENRRFAKGRCLVPVSWFYEFTGKKYPKTKWRFSKPGQEWFCIAGLWRPVENGAAFTMLTVDPGPDVARYHNRQVVVLERDDWSAWLDLNVSAEYLVRPSLRMAESAE